MSQEKSLVSVVITTYDRPELLERAINRALDQSYENMEILVVDHSGEKYAEELVDSYEEIKYLGTSEELGQIGAWNKGFKHVSGEYVQFHDDDDYLKSSKIKKQVDLLEKKENTGVAYCGVVSDQDEVLLPEKGNSGNVIEPVLKQYLPRCQTTTMLIESDLLDDVLPLYEFGNVGDLALQIELSQKTNFDYIDEPLVYRRITGESSGNSLLNRRKRKELITHYSELYEEHPKIRKKSIVKVNKMLAKKLEEEKFWSLEMIAAFFMISYYAKEENKNHFIIFLGSLLGSPGIKATRYLCSKISRSKNRMKIFNWLNAFST